MPRQSFNDFLSNTGTSTPTPRIGGNSSRGGGATGASSPFGNGNGTASPARGGGTPMGTTRGRGRGRGGGAMKDYSNMAPVDYNFINRETYKVMDGGEFFGFAFGTKLRLHGEPSNTIIISIFPPLRFHSCTLRRNSLPRSILHFHSLSLHSRFLFSSPRFSIHILLSR